MSNTQMEAACAPHPHGPVDRLLEPLRGWLRRGALRRDFAGLSPASLWDRLLSGPFVGID